VAIGIFLSEIDFLEIRVGLVMYVVEIGVEEGFYHCGRGKSGKGAVK
jgi:hypothetical protein